MFQPFTTPDQNTYFKFKHYINDNKVLDIKYPDAKYTIRNVKKWLEELPDMIHTKIRKAFDDCVLESEKTPLLLIMFEKECKDFIKYMPPERTWSMYERAIYYAFRKYIGERTLKKKELTIDHITVDINSDVITVHVTPLFKEEHMEFATNYFMNTYGASAVIFKIVSKID